MYDPGRLSLIVKNYFGFFSMVFIIHNSSSNMKHQIDSVRQHRKALAPYQSPTNLIKSITG